MLQTFVSGLLSVGLVPTVTETSVGVVFPVTYAGVAQIFLISLFIYCARPVTCGHFNPLITMGTFFTKLASLPGRLWLGQG
jgi:glycerol uptake facilitator-like aquaporin